MKKRILVVDDDIDIRSILEFILLQEDFEPILMHIGPSIEDIFSLQPDLILLDVMIDGFRKSGSDICAEFKSNAAIAKIPILLVSAEHHLDLLAKSCNADGFIPKPFDIEDLVNKVKEFLS